MFPAVDGLWLDEFGVGGQENFPILEILALVPWVGGGGGGRRGSREGRGKELEAEDGPRGGSCGSLELQSYLTKTLRKDSRPSLFSIQWREIRGNRSLNDQNYPNLGAPGHPAKVGICF